MPDQMLRVREYSLLFPVGLPQEAYEDVVYFFPLACHFICLNPDPALDLIDGLVAFSATCDAQLTHDGLKPEALTAFVSCLDEWAKGFNVIHFDRPQMIAKGSPHCYADYVVNSSQVFALLTSLVRFVIDGHVAEHYILHWSSRASRNPQSSGWFVECCRRFAEDELDWTTPMIESIVTSRDGKQSHYRRLVNEQNSLRVPVTYLCDSRRALDITENLQ